MRAIQRRVHSHLTSERNSEFTIKQMLSEWNARLLRPQRLVSLTFDEEERRTLRSWWRFDFKLFLATMVELEELSHLVSDPEMFRDNVRDLAVSMIVFMNDQIPMCRTLKPGKQVYAEWETRKGNYERNLGSLGGGGSQKVETLLNDDAEDEIMGLNEGMTQKRGEATKDQDQGDG